MNEEERRLVEMVLSGRSEAFEPLVRPYRRALLALAFRLTRNFEDAKEVSQEALLRAFKYLRRCDTSRSFRNWLFQIAANAARDRVKKTLGERGALEAAARARRPDPGPETGRSEAEFRSGLMACLTVLSPREREVFVMRDLEELDIKETARALGCSNISVRVHLTSARRKIRERLRRKHPHLEKGR